ncbi:methyl-accepting chemotaxis protein [Burkholderia sp. PAMC 26561]|uniref:methyl-accepting chemotaxis protein n=1 Tax=Burkholderia sp. PAMC 26561 TaxID=1795043 RepID=UPI00076B2AC3|nr:methyl-accepting chemotaxis protein [Burkholderia sp. PAMC 26561]AME26845.1 chemotaxis protein [Burkholderia sp. PAMC 26561]AME28010.1 chemotaxis protein [Burkholderia sp. PAMC 26561]
MPTFNQVNVFTKLVGGFSVVIALLIGLGIFSLFEIAGENEHVVLLSENSLPAVRYSLEMRGSLNAIRLGDYRAANSLSAVDIDAASQQVDQAIAGFSHAAGQYEPLINDPEEKKRYGDLQAAMSRYLDADHSIRTLAKDGKHDDAMSLLEGESVEFLNVAERSLKAIVDTNVAEANKEGLDSRNGFSRAVALVIAGTVAATLIGLALALLIARGLTRQLGGEPSDAATIAHAIAAGNLLVPIRLKDGDSASLLYSLATMKEQLTTIVRGIKTSSESISVAASEIAQGNTDLSQRTEEQAASLEETAASMEELTTTVRHNADNAKQAAALAGSASLTAQRGGEVVARVVDTMQGISDSASKVADIVSVIEGIAFQTNILALNAAVEAARAGEQGRGFAVVAGEVRTLAQRSATAAKEIGELIGESVHRVDAGSKLVSEAGATITEIVTSVQKVTDIVGEISSASAEQSVGIEQVNQAVSQMDEVTQQNAALVEQASAAAQSMADQSNSLRQAVSIFKVGESTVHSAPRPARWAPAKAAAMPSTKRAASLGTHTTADWQSF